MPTLTFSRVLELQSGELLGNLLKMLTPGLFPFLPVRFLLKISGWGPGSGIIDSPQGILIKLILLC